MFEFIKYSFIFFLKRGISINRWPRVSASERNISLEDFCRMFCFLLLNMDQKFTNVKILLNLFWLNTFLHEYKAKLLSEQWNSKTKRRSKRKRTFILTIVKWLNLIFTLFSQQLDREKNVVIMNADWLCPYLDYCILIFFRRTEGRYSKICKKKILY